MPSFAGDDPAKRANSECFRDLIGVGSLPNTVRQRGLIEFLSKAKTDTEMTQSPVLLGRPEQVIPREIGRFLDESCDGQNPFQLAAVVLHRVNAQNKNKIFRRKAFDRTATESQTLA